MSQRVRCILCGKEFDVFQDDTTPLLEHLRSSHPSVNLSDSEIDLLESKRSNMDAKNKATGKENNKPPIRKGIAGVENTNSKRRSTASSGGRMSRRGTDDIFLSAENCVEMSNVDCPDVMPMRDKRESLKKEPTDVDQTNRKNESSEIYIGAKFRRPSNDGNVLIIESGSGDLGPSQTKVLYRRKYKVQKPITPRSRSTIYYKTSVEKWRPGMGTIVCPKCGANKRPLIRVQADKVSYTPLGAACILTCWPFCFLPCLFPPPSKEYLHCAVCNHLLGVYDRKAEVIQPNEEECRKPPDENIMPEGRYSNVKR